MPTYEYRCKSCERPHEAQQSFTDPPLTVCPECGGSLRKVFGNIAVTFKGSGFYKNDSRSASKSSSSSSSSEKSEKAEKSEKSEKSGTRSESKSEPKSETKSEPKADSPTSSPAAAS